MSTSNQVGWAQLSRRTIAGIALSVAALSMGACGELEPMIEPEVADLQLTVDTLKTQIRDAQRSITELRSELEARRQELAEAHVMRAQLEGRVREAERRVAEARHVIDLQREELVAARVQRERISKSSVQLKSQINQLQKHLAKLRSPHEGAPGTAPASYDGLGGKVQRALTAAAPAAPVGVSPADRASAAHEVQGTSVRAVSVKPGDTLWSIAQRYQVDLHHLRSLNRLTDNRIAVGQAIWVPADRIPGNPAPEGIDGRR
jgi:LysM repeat protein